MNEPRDPFPFPDEQQVQMMERFREQSEVFATDLANYKRIIDAIEANEKRMFAKEAPADYTITNETEFDVTHGFYAGYKILRDLGADLVFLGPEHVRPSEFEDPRFYVSIRSKDKIATSVLIDIYGNEHDPVFGLFEFGFQNRTAGMFNNDLAERLATHPSPKLEELQKTDLIKRAQMRDTLAGGIAMLRKPDEVAAHTTPKLVTEEHEAIARYEELRRKGIQPLGLEETYGLLGDTIRDYLTRHTDKHLVLTRGSN